MMANNTTCLKLFYEQVPGSSARQGRQAPWNRREGKKLHDKLRNIIIALFILLTVGNMTTEQAIKQFYKLLARYISDGERIIVNIPFPEISKRIEGILSVNKLEEVTIRLKNEKF